VGRRQRKPASGVQRVDIGENIPSIWGQLETIHADFHGFEVSN